MKSMNTEYWLSNIAYFACVLSVNEIGVARGFAFLAARAALYLHWLVIH